MHWPFRPISLTIRCASKLQQARPRCRRFKIDLGPSGDRLERAESMRKAQTQATPPADTPWCFYDLAEIHLYRCDHDGFIRQVVAGILDAPRN
ncbi:MAG: hypothetical protein V5B40_14110 [Candidatus Accumulibacter meliphilus]|uniref:hypothetical protein n=1 Tax=Candidatus Accumulibacter meliphilus TaxID=2211374 RepID=UPI002FC302BD